jgi:hypothetical protein
MVVLWTDDGGGAAAAVMAVTWGTGFGGGDALDTARTFVLLLTTTVGRLTLGLEIV